MDNQTVKIFLTYKNKNKVIKSDILTPIQTGRAVSDEIFHEMIGDDTGDNISHLNAYFCELTAIYWVWKNYDKIGNPDKIGFMHYRRHFVLNKAIDKIHQDDYFINFNNLDLACLEACGLTDKVILERLTEYDCIIPQPYKQPPVREQYANAHNVSDFDLAIKVLVDKYPEWEDVSKEYSQCTYPFFFCMFVMPREQFFEMCEWLFDILFAVQQKIDISQYDSYQSRALGFIGERLIGMYLYNLSKSTNLKIEHCHVSFVNSTSYEIEPIYEQRNAVCFASSDYYVPYLMVALESLKQHATATSNYDIIIFERNISRQNKKLITNKISATNISIRFCNPMSFFEGLNIFTYEHIPLETYFKITMPNMLKNFDRILFLDSDMLIIDDVDKLLQIDLCNKTIGAHYCTLWSGIASRWPHVYDYTKNKLGLNNVNDYFQGGVLLFDVKKYIAKNYMERLIELSAKEKFICVDQCALNSICKEDVHYFDGAWNYETLQRGFHDTIGFAPHYFLLEREVAKLNPRIIHYSGPAKPWKFTDEESADIWWFYARQTPLYEEIIKRSMVERTQNLCEAITASCGHDFYRMYVRRHYKKLRMQMMFLRFAKHISFGHVSRRSNEKYRNIKQKLKSYK